jgi:hypothetical protein
MSRPHRMPELLIAVVPSLKPEFWILALRRRLAHRDLYEVDSRGIQGICARDSYGEGSKVSSTENLIRIRRFRRGSQIRSITRSGLPRRTPTRRTTGLVRRDSYHSIRQRLPPLSIGLPLGLPRRPYFRSVAQQTAHQSRLGALGSGHGHWRLLSCLDLPRGGYFTGYAHTSPPILSRIIERTPREAVAAAPGCVRLANEGWGIVTTDLTNGRELRQPINSIPDVIEPGVSAIETSSMMTDPPVTYAVSPRVLLEESGCPGVFRRQMARHGGGPRTGIDL